MFLSSVFEIGFLMGLLGSVHCIGMCGPLVMALPISQKNTFQKFREFKNQMNAKVFFSESETKPGVFERNKKFRLKSNFVPPTEYTAVNKIFAGTLGMLLMYFLKKT